MSKKYIFKLKDVANITMGQSPKSEYYNQEGEGTPFLQGNSTFGDKYPKIEKYTTKETRISNKNEVLMSVRAPVGDININPFEKICVGRGLCSIQLHNNQNEYLYYFLKANQRKIQNKGTGTVFSAINKSDVENIEIYIPDEIQIENITKKLKVLDDKIENNNAIITNLEEQAQTIFKSWFVDFEPFQDEEFIESELGRIPNNWTAVTLKEVSEEIVTGKTPPTKDPENYGNKMPFVTIPDMHNNVYAIETERLLSDKGIDTQSNKVVPKNSISVSCIATVGLVTLIASDSMTNQQINTVITKENISSYYVYNHLKTQSDYLNAIGSSGSTTKNVNKTTFSNLKMLLPSESILKKYHRLCEPIFEYILLIQKQNKKLVETRDTLLPKLMSGEIRVEEATEVN